MKSSGDVHVGMTYIRSGPIAQGYRQRRKGLARINLTDAPAELSFERCRSIHTFGMRFDLSVLFLDRNNRVIASRITKPRRLVIAPRGTYTIVERPLR
ncbi:MAG TPA: DUF192 domain-containing protein [Acidimicrobiia bacterium]|nr:DUF192 domain-containing protein [Acidimicrobiia bacterium]